MFIGIAHVLLVSQIDGWLVFMRYDELCENGDRETERVSKREREDKVPCTQCTSTKI